LEIRDHNASSPVSPGDFGGTFSAKGAQGNPFMHCSAGRVCAGEAHFLTWTGGHCRLSRKEPQGLNRLANCRFTHWGRTVCAEERPAAGSGVGSGTGAAEGGFARKKTFELARRNMRENRLRQGFLGLIVRMLG